MGIMEFSMASIIIIQCINKTHYTQVPRYFVIGMSAIQTKKSHLSNLSIIQRAEFLSANAGLIVALTGSVFIAPQMTVQCRTSYSFPVDEIEN